MSSKCSTIESMFMLNFPIAKKSGARFEVCVCVCVWRGGGGGGGGGGGKE